jgi:AraC family transcriptional regulator
MRMADRADPGTHGPQARVLAGNADWRIREFTCDARPGDRPFEERHEGATIAAVVEGVFTYRSDSGKALLHPGAFLLGNHGRCFECGHEHGAGDRCVSITYTPDFFAEIAASAAGGSRYAFPSGMLPPLGRLAAWTTELDLLAGGLSAKADDETAIALAEAVIGAASGHPASSQRISPRDERCIARVLRHVEEHFDDPLDLARLAGVAGTSKYHFLRIFRRATGITPHQFLLAVRMHRAAMGLASVSESITSIAFDTGFGDLSTFIHRFRKVYGDSPSAFRNRARKSGSGPVRAP